MIFEDAHWADPTSLEAFGRAIDQIAALRVLLIVTFRPEFQAPWIGQPHVSAVTIGRLTRRDVDALINGVVGNKRLPVNIRQDIIERTDGIPLFVEEMTKAVLEAESEGAADHTAAIRRWIVSFSPDCCSGRACPRIRVICSNTRWSRTRPMARYCGSRGARFMLASPKSSKPNLPRLPRTNPSLWRVTAQRLA
jgi:hypothetical protein